MLVGRESIPINYTIHFQFQILTLILIFYMLNF